jgi:hypothetical protein
MKCADPSSWPEPSTEYACEDAGYGAVRVRAWAKMHPKVRAHEGRGSRGPLPIVVGTLVLVEVERLPRGERRREPRVLWLWWHGEGEPDLDLLWQAYIRRFELEHTFRFLKQTLFGVDHPSGAPSRAGRSVDVGGGGRLHANCAWPDRALRIGGCRGRDATLPCPPNARAGPSRRFGAFA